MTTNPDLLKEVVHIIIVEDNLSDMRIIEAAFSRLDFPVILHLYNDGQEAIDAIRSTTQILKPDLVITDLHMPKKRGEDLIRELRAIPGLSGVPIAVFSGFTEEFRKSGGELRGEIAAFLTKSELYADMEKFIAELRKLCEKSRAG